MEESRPTWSSRTKIVVSLLLLAFGLFLIYRFSVVLPPLILAVILAYVLTPLVNRLQPRLRLPRVLVVFLVYLMLVLVLVSLLFLIIPPLAAQFTALNLDIQRFLLEIESWLASQYTIAGMTIDVEYVFQQVIGSLQGLLEPVFGQTLELLLDVITSLVWVVFIVVVSFYLIKDAHSLHSWLEGLVPAEYRQDYIRLRDEINRIWGAFFRGQLLLATVVSILFTVIGFILGLPFSLAMGVFAGLMEFFPSIGHGIWLMTASLLALFAGSTWIPLPNWAFALIIIGLHLFFQQFDLNYLIPRIIGRSVQLPPLVVILGIVGGAVTVGVLGILLAAPTIASARVLARYIYANLFDQDPFPTSVVSALPPPNPRWWRRSSSSLSADMHPDVTEKS